MIAIPLATYRADPKVAMDLAERDPDGRVVVTDDDGSTCLTIAIPKDARPSEADVAEQLAEARREIDRLKRAPGVAVMEAARLVVSTWHDDSKSSKAVSDAVYVLESALADAVPVELQDGERIQHAAEAIRYKEEIERLTAIVEDDTAILAAYGIRRLGDRRAPRIVEMPDAEGWWANRRGPSDLPRSSLFVVKRIKDQWCVWTDECGWWPAEGFGGSEWFGPIALPEGWS